ncbi:GDSL-type esterase/lipase family protein [Streptomyces sp. NPDC053367]|uniref:GDSL-type esterase/lipase family protein n=1 Tax=Streptomyces sp. NPDC053367 TaxID=3365700 RepID=UPI0037D0DACF
MTRRRQGHALLAAITALVVVLSAALYVTVAAHDGTARRTLAAGRPHGAGPGSAGRWVGTWSASPAAAEPGTGARGTAGRSLRNVVHTSVGGTSARVTLSNLLGSRPLRLTHASIALAAEDEGPAAAPGTMRRLTFGGRTAVVVPPGRQTVSDPVALPVPADADVLITTYSPTPSGPVTIHPRARQTSYAAVGQHTEDLAGTAYTERTEAWRYVTALDVLGSEADGTVVVLGDSLTDGSSSSTDENRRWPDALARRLRAAAEDGRDVPRHGVVNQGISGNRLLADGYLRPLARTVRPQNPSGLRRFSRDVLGTPGVEVVVVDLGVNDILRDPALADPDRILAGLRALVARAHARGVRAVGATLMPFKGHPGYTDAREEVRRRINAEIRAGRVFDAVADFDEALRDPYDPRRLRFDYDCGDHLHPSDRGYARMAEAVDLADLGGNAVRGARGTARATTTNRQQPDDGVTRHGAR